jgi:hypothetical protein
VFSTPSGSKKLGGEFFSQGMMKAKKRSLSVTSKRKKPTFQLPNIVEDPLVRDNIRESFKRAFYSKGMKYVTSLVYDRPDCTEDTNDPKREKKVQVLIKQNN